MKLADNKYFIEKIIDQVHYLPKNISIKTKKFLREKQEVSFFVEGEDECIDVSPDFF